MLPETGGADKARLMSQAPYMTTHGISGKWNRGSVKQIRGDRVRPPAGRCEVEESHAGYEHEHQVVDLVDLRDAPDERPEPVVGADAGGGPIEAVPVSTIEMPELPGPDLQRRHRMPTHEVQREPQRLPVQVLLTRGSHTKNTVPNTR